MSYADAYSFFNRWPEKMLILLLGTRPTRYSLIGPLPNILSWVMTRVNVKGRGKRLYEWFCQLRNAYDSLFLLQLISFQFKRQASQWRRRFPTKYGDEKLANWTIDSSIPMIGHLWPSRMWKKCALRYYYLPKLRRIAKTAEPEVGRHFDGEESSLDQILENFKDQHCL